MILGILAGIVVFAVQSLASSSGQASCSTDYKTVQTALEAYKAQMGGYPNGFVSDDVPATSPRTSVGSLPTGTNATAMLLTGSDVGGDRDSNSNPTANGPSESGSSVGPWLKSAPANPDHYQIYVSNDGKGTILVLDGNGNVAGPASGNGGNGVSDCNDLP